MVFDNNLQFRNTTASLTGTETSAALEIGSTPIDGLALVVDIPKKDIGDTLGLTLQHSADGSSWFNLLVIDTIASVTQTSTIGTKVVRRFHTQLKYVRLIMTTLGTNPDFGAIKARIGDRDNWQTAGLAAATTPVPS